ncbi:MAG: FkbM family methyltransferase [Acidobacteriia bacterium]|nr:FkbM family methyltransferase [Terriglobia bacterium]
MRTKVFRRLSARVVAVEPQESCMAILRRAYGRDPEVALVQAACGAASGQAIMRACELDVLSSLSDEWITAVSNSGRFTPAWTKQEPCTLITVDELIRTYGSPAFIKIDVEGYELQVLKGLSRVVPCLSFEFTPERCEAAAECAERLSGLGFREFNLSRGESFELLFDPWVQQDELVPLLRSYREDTVIFGDVYARS